MSSSHVSNPDLLGYQTQLRRLLSELILTEQRERRRIATDLHDHLAQLLVASKMKLALLRNQIKSQTAQSNQAAQGAQDEDHPEKLLDQLDDCLDESLAYTRNLVAQISPVLLYEQGLITALNWLADRVMPAHGLNVTLHSQTDLANEQLNEDARILLFESVRELLFNVVEHAQTSYAELIVRQRDGGLEVIVADDGVGFDSETQPAPSTDKPAGFGLFSIHERMTLIGGRFELNTWPNEGTHAALWMPLGPTPIEMVALLNEPTPATATTTAVPVAPPEPRPATHPGETIRLLVVDDHAVVRQGLVTMLSREPGLTVIGEANNGQTALDMAQNLRPDAVLMDVSMPGMDGIETTSRLTAAHPDVKVIGLSMHEDDSVANAMHNAGAATYLCKGCCTDALVQAIRNVVHV